jgi:nucleotide-binding universal stress UspA family protein
MPEETYVVAYESDERPHVLDYAAKQAAKSGAKLHIVHVLEWSPYAFLTPEELEERHARRQTELKRAQTKLVDPAVERVNKAGVSAEGEIRHGQVVEIVAEIAEKIGASMIFVGRAGGNALGARIFGSVPLGIAQIASVPTVIVP